MRPRRSFGCSSRRIGILAFSYVLPITLAMVGVLVLLILSYRQTIKAYPSAGGAYIVTKDNLGLLPAQVAGVALLTDYILTVAVSVSAGVAALYSAFEVLRPYRVPIALGFIVIIAWGNLRGVKESGRIFAVPTYAFIFAIFTMLAVGRLQGNLRRRARTPARSRIQQPSRRLVWQGSSCSSTRSPPVARPSPAWRPSPTACRRSSRRSGRTPISTLVAMGSLLGVMFIGISWLAMQLQAVPNEHQTVIAQVAQAVFGSGPLGHVLFLFTQAATMLILVLAANTSFADFPRLASFHADDAFMPKQLTKRGHRLVFSNGIIALAIAGALPVVIFQADVTHLIPLYAIGVFTSFTLSQAGHGPKAPDRSRSRGGAAACSSTASARSPRASSPS